MKLVLNAREAELAPGTSIFEAAERLGVRVPTSCHKQWRCRECLVEVASGEELLTPRTPEEEHLEPGFRLACRARAESGPGVLRCHTLRRGELRIEQQAHGLPDRGERPRLDPAVTRDGERVLLEGREIARSSGPLHGIALDLGRTNIGNSLGVKHGPGSVVLSRLALGNLRDRSRDGPVRIIQEYR